MGGENVIFSGDGDIVFGPICRPLKFDLECRSQLWEEGEQLILGDKGVYLADQEDVCLLFL
jgi:hypothetical protein